MDTISLAKKLALHPRAAMFYGELVAPPKMGGKVSRTDPFYLVRGNPPVEYSPDGDVRSYAAAASVECNIVEIDNGLSGLSVFTGARAVSNFCQVAFGADGHEPTLGQYHVLREAGRVIASVAASKRRVYVAVVPVLKPAKFGTQGVLAMAGIFDDDGAPLWIHPSALDSKLLTSKFPASQRYCSSTSEAAAPRNSEIEQTHRTLTSAGLTGKALENGMVKALRGTLGEGAEAAVKAFLSPGSRQPPVAASDAPKSIKAGVLSKLKEKASAKTKGPTP